jgi:hypothetical protein
MWLASLPRVFPLASTTNQLLFTSTAFAETVAIISAFENDFEKCEYKQVDDICQAFLWTDNKKCSET